MNTLEREINKALNILRKGGVILYPSDTIWGIGCDATNTNAIKKIYNIKRRKESKALITLVSNKTQLKKLTGHIPNLDIISNPTTIIYPNVKFLSSNILAKDGSAAIRIANDTFCNKLINQLDFPIVSTSANISGNSYPKKFSEITDEIKDNVDYIVNLRQKEIMDTPSSIIKINTLGDIEIIRK